MISQNQLTKRYAKLIDDVKKHDYYRIDLTNRLNCYACSCGHITKTKDVDAGCTPMRFRCEECGQLAMSTNYNDVASAQKPTFEWYRPTLTQLMKARKKDLYIEHVLSGGLDYRSIKE